MRRISAIEPDALGTVLTPRLTAGTADLRRGVVVSQNQADMLGLRLGDPITLAPGGVPVRSSVAGVYEATELAASIYYDVALAPPAVRGAISTVYATGQDPAGVRAAVAAAFAQRPDVRVTDRLGVLTGVFVGTVMQHAMLGQQLWNAVVPFGTIALCLAGIVVAAVLAAVWPARTAACTDVLAAIAAHGAQSGSMIARIG